MTIMTRIQVYKCPKCGKVEKEILDDLKGGVYGSYDMGSYTNEIFCIDCAAEIFKASPKHKVDWQRGQKLPTRLPAIHEKGAIKKRKPA